MVKMNLSCAAGIKSCGARCAHMAINGTPYCHIHQGEGVSVVEPPDRILIGVNLNQNWDKKFAALGVKERQQDGNFDPREKEAILAKRAVKVGRNPHRHRGPAVVDNGSQVMGQGGGRKLSLVHLLPQLRESYDLTGYYFRPRRQENRNMGRIVVARLTLQEYGLPDVNSHEFWPKFCELGSVPFEYNNTWANLPDDDGLIVDTVNVSGRLPELEKTPEGYMHFASEPGNWLVEMAEVPVPATNAS